MIGVADWLTASLSWLGVSDVEPAVGGMYHVPSSRRTGGLPGGGDRTQSAVSCHAHGGGGAKGGDRVGPTTAERATADTCGGAKALGAATPGSVCLCFAPEAGDSARASVVVTACSSWNCSKASDGGPKTIAP